MNLLFPVEFLCRFSKRQVFFTWAIFVLFVSVPTIMGYVPTYQKNFFSPSEHIVWTCYFAYMDIIHTRVINVLFSLFLPILEFWVIYFLSGLKQTIAFRTFVLPFLSYAYIGIVLRAIDIIPGVKVLSGPIGVLVSIYFLVFFIFMAIKIYSIKPLKSIFAVLAAFFSVKLLFFLLTGPTVGIILQELNENGWLLGS